MGSERDVGSFPLSSQSRQVSPAHTGEVTTQSQKGKKETGVVRKGWTECSGSREMQETVSARRDGGDQPHSGIRWVSQLRLNPRDRGGKALSLPPHLGRAVKENGGA